MDLGALESLKGMGFDEAAARAALAATGGSMQDAIDQMLAMEFANEVSTTGVIVPPPSSSSSSISSSSTPKPAYDFLLATELRRQYGRSS